MVSWTPVNELHANTRRTRLTYRGWLNDTDVALKAYRAPFRGLFHWFRTHRKADRLRRLGVPLPDVIYSGWLPGLRCFCIAYRFMDNHDRLQERLAHRDPASSWPDVEHLLSLFAHCHRLGVMQTDANLTNFLLSRDNQWVILDEDDLQLRRGPLDAESALFNLAAVVSRIPGLDPAGRQAAWESYRRQGGVASADSLPMFEAWLAFWDRRLADKVRKRRS